MPRPATPGNCHRPIKYVPGDRIWYLRNGMLAGLSQRSMVGPGRWYGPIDEWRKGKVAGKSTRKSDTSDGAKRWLVSSSITIIRSLSWWAKITDSKGEEYYHVWEDDMRKQGSEWCLSYAERTESCLGSLAALVRRRGKEARSLMIWKMVDEFWKQRENNFRRFTGYLALVLEYGIIRFRWIIIVL